jgi:hypothetical protein
MHLCRLQLAIICHSGRPGNDGEGVGAALLFLASSASILSTASAVMGLFRSS